MTTVQKIRDIIGDNQLAIRVNRNNNEIMVKNELYTEYIIKLSKLNLIKIYPKEGWIALRFKYLNENTDDVLREIVNKYNDIIQIMKDDQTGNYMVNTKENFGMSPMDHEELKNRAGLHIKATHRIFTIIGPVS